MNANPHGLLADRELREDCPPLNILTEDWAHIWLVGGVGHQELGKCLRAFKTTGVTYENFRDEMKLWKSPKQNHQFQNAWMLFTEKRWESSKDSKQEWKSGTSEFLSIYPVVFGCDLKIKTCERLAWRSPVVRKAL